MAKMSADKPVGGAGRGGAGATRRAQAIHHRPRHRDHPRARGSQGRGIAAVQPPERAYINIPGPYEKGLPSVYYISPPDPTWPRPAQDAYIPGKADLLFTSVHEVWPGHFLNFLHANRSKDMFGRVFVGYAFAEGWAHYTEEMMRVRRRRRRRRDA